jgi:hypothetical protein
MKKTKILISILLVFTVFAAQIRVVSAAPALITGTVQSITLETDANTAVTTVLITVLNNEISQTVRISVESAITLGIVTLGGDGNPMINELVLGQPIEIAQAVILTEEQVDQHPVGSALATFFSDILNLDYETVMTAHEDGAGFGVIAQALWLTKKLQGDADLFLAIMEAKKTGDYSVFVLEDGTNPKNWDQFKKAVMDGKKGKPGIGISDKVKKNNDNNDTSNENNKDKDKEKENDKQKDKDKEKNKNKDKGKDK